MAAPCVALVVATSCAPVLIPPLILVASWPTAGASLPVGDHALEMTFNRALDPAASAATVWRDGRPVQAQAGIDRADAHRLTVHMGDPRAGTYELQWHAVAAQSTSASDGRTTFALDEAAPMPPRIEVKPSAADVKKPFTLSGQGFASTSKVQLAVGDDQESVTTIQADARGSFTREVPVPEDLPFGIQPLTVVDDQGRRATAALEVRYGGWPPAVPIDKGQPGPDRGEVTFTVSIRNRSDYVLEHVTLVLKDPDAATFVGTDPRAERQDRAWVWEIATLARGVQGPFTATYRADAPVVSQAWMQFRHRPERGCVQDCQPAFISDSAAESQPITPRT